LKLKLRALAGNVLLMVGAPLTVLLLLEGMGSMLMTARAAKSTIYMQEESHARYDPDLGWSHRPLLQLPDLYGPGARFTTNAQGFRGTESYAPQAPRGRYRVVCLGDSFTMGFGVSDDETYAARMQAGCPTLQTVNMGQGGYGLDQIYLWYKRDGAPLQPDLLVFAVIAQDFYRMNGDDFIGYPKPVLRVRDGRLAVDNVPVPRRWGQRTTRRRVQAFFDGLGLVRTLRWLGRRGPAVEERFYGEVRPEALSAAALALDDLAAAARGNGRQLALVYLPTRDTLGQEPTPEATWMEEYARRTHVPFVNLVPEFARLPPWEIAALFRPDHHYTEHGNRFVAEALLRLLRERVPGFPDCGTTPAPQSLSQARSSDS
jgi:hypothetical protein